MGRTGSWHWFEARRDMKSILQVGHLIRKDWLMFNRPQSILQQRHSVLPARGSTHRPHGRAGSAGCACSRPGWGSGWSSGAGQLRSMWSRSYQSPRCSPMSHPGGKQERVNKLSWFHPPFSAFNISSPSSFLTPICWPAPASRITCWPLSAPHSHAALP